MANRVTQGGYENTKDYYTNCEIIFCDIDNIHVVREAYNKIYDLGMQLASYGSGGNNVNL